MKIKQVLENLCELLEKWNLFSNDWILTGQYADRLQGYEVTVRRGHLNIIVPKTKIPWKFGKVLEIHPPSKTLVGKQFEKFCDKTGFEFDILPFAQKTFAQKKKKTVRYRLNSGKSVFLLHPLGELELLADILQKSNERGWGIEKGKRILSYVEEFAKELKRKKERKIASAFLSIAAKFQFLKRVTRHSCYLRDGRLEGLTAYKGKVKGIARIVIGPTKEEFNKGDILVTKMTSPKFIPLMSKAAAVVTDAGGQLCHAAIVSRELKIPCIIGTKNATEFFRDGDLVEVDANKGIVKVLKRAK